MTAIGETLRRERLRRNLDLEKISRELKISPKLLEAIEDEKFDRLPGGVFAKAFVRQYARFLGLDEEEMAAEVQRMLHPAAEAAPEQNGHPAVESIPLPKVEAWQSVGERRFQWSSPLPALALVVVVMMGCAGIYSWWQRTRHAAPAPTAVAAAPPAAQPVQPQQPQQQTPSPTQPAAEASAVGQPQPNPAPPSAQPAQSTAESTVAAQPAVADRVSNPAPANPAQPAPVTGADAAQPSNPNAAVRVELVANEAVWVLARSDGKYLFSGTIEANQTRTVE